MLQAEGALPTPLLSLGRMYTRQTAHITMESSAPHLPPKDTIGSAEDNSVMYVKMW